MELKPGYKLTEVGVIPEDWDVVNVDKLASIIDPQPDHRTPPETSGGEPYIGISDFINDTNVDWDSCRKIIPKALDKQQQSFHISHGDIIFGKIGTIGAPKFLPVTPFRYALSANVILIKPKFEPHFLMSWLKSSLVQKQINQDLHSTSQPAFGILKMRNLLIASPPLPEQRSIAAALSDMDELLGGLDRLITKKRDLKQGTMQQLLTGEVRLPGFGQGKSYKQTEFGLIPEDWVLTPLSKISAFITKGSTPTTYGFNWTQDGIIFLRSECVAENGLDLSQSMFISKQAHFTLKRSELRSGDLLITITGNVGRVVYLSKDFGIGNMNQHIARVRITDDRVCAKFVYHYLSQSTIRKAFNAITTGQAYPQISLKQVRDAVVPLSSLEEQIAIASILSDMDTEIATLEQRRNKTRDLKQAMMQELLTGRIRLL
jgi:type I restriction enzyme, S subunit